MMVGRNLHLRRSFDRPQWSSCSGSMVNSGVVADGSGRRWVTVHQRLLHREEAVVWPDFGITLLRRCSSAVVGDDDDMAGEGAPPEPAVT
ncbi:hypothetical protein L1887_32027 [Cichorium endivia]|nr:hypothetical protein L1887_32027 [Cichorium endivia]